MSSSLCCVWLPNADCSCHGYGKGVDVVSRRCFLLLNHEFSIANISLANIYSSKCTLTTFEYQLSHTVMRCFVLPGFDIDTI